jgi:hypothetical protein
MPSAREHLAGTGNGLLDSIQRDQPQVIFNYQFSVIPVRGYNAWKSGNTNSGIVDIVMGRRRKAQAVPLQDWHNS